jgi:hypothetical protein
MKNLASGTAACGFAIGGAAHRENENQTLPPTLTLARNTGRGNHTLVTLGGSRRPRVAPQLRQRRPQAWAVDLAVRRIR